MGAASVRFCVYRDLSERKILAVGTRWDTMHFSFSDQSLLKSQCLMRMLSSVGEFGKLEAHRGLTITAKYVPTFFDVYLKGALPLC